MRASSVLPLPVGPMSRMLLLSISTSLWPFVAEAQPLVVVVDGDREDLLGALLADDVLVELFLDVARRRDVR